MIRTINLGVAFLLEFGGACCSWLLGAHPDPGVGPFGCSPVWAGPDDGGALGRFRGAEGLCAAARRGRPGLPGAGGLTLERLPLAAGMAIAGLALVVLCLINALMLRSPRFAARGQ